MIDEKNLTLEEMAPGIENISDAAKARTLIRMNDTLAQSEEDETSPEEEFARYVHLNDIATEEGVSARVGVGSYAAALHPIKQEPLEPAKDIQELFDNIPSQKQILLTIMEFCREPRFSAQIDEAVAPLTQYRRSVYTPVILRDMLRKHQALKYILPEGYEYVEEEAAASANEYAFVQEETQSDEDYDIDERGDEWEQAVTDANAASAVTEPKVPTSLANVAAGIDPITFGSTPVRKIASPETLAEMSADDNATGLNSDKSAESTETAPLTPEEEFGGEELVIEDIPEGTWMTTEAGIAFLEEQSFEKAALSVIDAHKEYERVYYHILEFCAIEGRTMPQIDALVLADPITQSPKKLFAGFFVGGLEDSGVLVWEGAWKTTDRGVDLLNAYRNRLGDAYVPVPKDLNELELNLEDIELPDMD